MKADDAIRANELVTALQEGLEMQAEILEGLHASLQAYSNFLTEQVRETQRQSLRAYDAVDEIVSNCCGAQATGGGDELGHVGRCSFCFEGCVFVKEEMPNE